ncbi:MAG: SDR family oxidoreductase [Pseudomonadota bacterium]
MTVDLADQVVLITGANRGIGREMATALGRHRAQVALTARDPDTLLDVAKTIDASGGTSSRFQLDVCNAASVERAVDTVINRYGRIDLLINNAGIGDGTELPWEQSVDALQAVLDVNLLGPFRVTRAVMPHMQRAGSGRIVDVGSLIGANPNPRATPYAVSKAALFRWNSCLAAGAEPFGVKVFIISPGLVRTDMTSIPRFDDIPADQWVPIEKTGELIVALASGRADALSGRFIHAMDDLNALVAAADDIQDRNLQTLGFIPFEP